MLWLMSNALNEDAGTVKKKGWSVGAKNSPCVRASLAHRGNSSK
jgi:hypothetical protein